jgi:phosphopantetheinyl transferase
MLGVISTSRTLPKPRKTEQLMSGGQSSNFNGSEGIPFVEGCSPPALNAGEIHVWLKASTDGPEGRTLSSSRAVAANEASQKLLLEVLSHYAGHPVFNHELLRTEFGKPYLEAHPCFNLSHSAGATAIAISLHDVGIDIEHPMRATSCRQLADKYFTAEEKALIDACPESGVGRLFLRHWVAKEAITKLVGVGIYRGIRDAQTDHAMTPPSASYAGRRVFLEGCGAEIGMVGSVACWQPAKVNVFVIGKKSAMIL